jgi:hypothetical protein
MAANVGYSIGWIYPEQCSDAAKVFSSIYLFIGAVMLLAALAVAVDAFIEGKHAPMAIALFCLAQSRFFLRSEI